MEQSQLVELIRKLNPEEQDQILQFASLPFFSGSKMKVYVIPLLEYCFNQDWDNTAKTLSKDEVYISVFQDSPFVKGKLEKAMVEAYKLIRNFLLAQYYFREENEFSQNFDFAKIIRLRGLDAKYKQLLQQLEKIQKSSACKDAAYFNRQFELELALHDEESKHNRVKGDLNIPPSLDALEMYTHLNRLALLNVYLIQQKAANVVVADSMRARLENVEIPERYLNAAPSILIHYTIFCLLKKDKPKGADIKYLFELLLANEGRLDKESLQAFYTYLRNLCIILLSSDPQRIDVSQQLFELYNDNIERGYIHYEGKLHPSRLLSINEVALNLGQFQWALEFIEKNKNDIQDENETQDFYRLNLAYYQFCTGRYESCLDNISPTSPILDYNLQGKRLELMSLFELQSELLPYKLDAFKMFLSRTSKKLLPDNRRKRNLDFFNLFLRIYSCPPGNKKRAERILASVMEKKQSANWQWLLLKAQQLQD